MQFCCLRKDIEIIGILESEANQDNEDSKFNGVKN